MDIYFIDRGVGRHPARLASWAQWARARGPNIEPDDRYVRQTFQSARPSPVAAGRGLSDPAIVRN
jgi:hypothetical protein